MTAAECFAIRIKELRMNKGMGIRQLGSELGIAHSTISRYENGLRIADIDTCKLFADYFNTTCDYLCGLTDVREKNI